MFRSRLFGLRGGLAALLLASTFGMAQEVTKHYQFGDARLQGVVVVKTQFGAPGFENDGESPKVRVKMLKLDRPIAIAEKDPSSHEFDPVESIQMVQLVELTGVDLSKMVGHRVSAKGVLEGARTGHHYTSAILVIANTEDVKSVPKQKGGTKKK